MSNNLTSIYSILTSCVKNEITKNEVFDPLNVPIHNDGRYYISHYTIEENNKTITKSLTFQTLIKGNCAIISNLNQLNDQLLKDCKTIYLNSQQTEKINNITHDNLVKLYLNDDIYELTDSVFFNCSNLKFINMPLNVISLNTIQPLFSNNSDLTVMFDYKHQDMILKLSSDYSLTSNYISFNKSIYQYPTINELILNNDFSDVVSIFYTNSRITINSNYSSPNLKTLVAPNYVNDTLLFNQINISDINKCCDDEIKKFSFHFPNLELLILNNGVSGINQRFNLINNYNFQLGFIVDTNNFMNGDINGYITSTKEKLRMCNFSRCWNTLTLNEGLKSNLKSLMIPNFFCIGPDDNNFNLPRPDYFSDITKGLKETNITIFINSMFKFNDESSYFNNYEGIEYSIMSNSGYVKTLNEITNNQFELNNDKTSNLNSFNLLNAISISKDLNVDSFDFPNTLIVPNFTYYVNLDGNLTYTLTDSSAFDGFSSFIDMFKNLNMLYINTSVYTAVSDNLLLNFPKIKFIPVYNSDSTTTTFTPITITINDCITEPFTETNDVLRICNFTRCWNTTLLDTNNKSNLTGLVYNNLVCVGPDDNHFSIPDKNYFINLTQGLNNPNINITLTKDYSKYNCWFNTVENINYIFIKDDNNRQRILSIEIDHMMFNPHDNLLYTTLDFLCGKTLENDYPGAICSMPYTLLIPNVTYYSDYDISPGSNLTNITASDGFIGFVSMFTNLEKLYLNTSVYTVMSDVLINQFPNIDFIPVETNSINWPI